MGENTNVPLLLLDSQTLSYVLGNGEFRFTNLKFDEAKAIIEMNGLENVAVSYTHLDVYKRQALACLVGVVLFHDKFNVKNAIASGMGNGFNSLMVTSAIMGFGGVVTASPAFGSFTNWILSLQMNPILFACVAINVICAITGSASGGITIFWNTLADYMIQTGLNAQIMHRITCIACSGLDAMPHSSGIVLANSVAKTEMKDSYFYMFVTNAAIPLCGLILAIILYSIGPVSYTHLDVYKRQSESYAEAQALPLFPRC